MSGAEWLQHMWAACWMKRAVLNVAPAPAPQNWSVDTQALMQFDLALGSKQMYMVTRHQFFVGRALA